MRLVVLLPIVIVCAALLWFFQATPDATAVKAQPLPIVPANSTPINYQTQVEPILNQRCVVCHACYDAPCQLKLTSKEGLLRGAHKDKVYDGERLLAATPTRLHVDAHSTAEWAKLGFHSVIPSSTSTPQSNVESSVMAQLLLQKKAQPLPTSRQLPESFKLSLNDDYSCPTSEEIGNYQKEYPLGGMPYGLPGLSSTNHNTLIQWISEGADTGKRAPLSKAINQQIDKWENFFNQDSLQAQLMSRYIYEHLFLANLWFFEDDKPTFFKVVRSKTAPGTPIDIIRSRSPLSDPQVPRVYYRLQQYVDVPVNKTHMPYQLDDARMERWKKWFLQPGITITNLPNYDATQRGNPFLTFKDIPLNARYRFLLDEAQFTIMGYIKGPVCRGQVALNVINDHFWVSFVNPDLPISDDESSFLQEHAGKLTLPASDGANANPLQWMLYAKQEKDYLIARSEFLSKHLAKKISIDSNLIWDGDGTNKNAGLTIFRHIDNATVIQGLHGDKPQTAWLISYPLLERIHYLLVAGFDVYGNVGHQLNSRIYMDFLRMEGEHNFLALLPIAQRQKVRDQWYRGALSPVALYLKDRYLFKQETQIPYSTEKPLNELYHIIKTRLAPVHNNTHDLAQNTAISAAFAPLQNKPNVAAQHLPQTVFIAVKEADKTHYFTLLHQMQFSNISHLFSSDSRRRPNEDTTLFLQGFVGAHPEAFLSVEKKQLPQLVTAISSLRSKEDWRNLMDNYGVRRNAPTFWQFSDALHKAQAKASPITAALFDYNRLEND